MWAAGQRSSKVRTRAHGGDEVVHRLLGEELLEEAGPVGLDLHAGLLDQGGDVVGLWMEEAVGEGERDGMSGPAAAAECT